jgi:hypothetical protein
VIDQIFFDADVPCQHVSQETIRESGPGVELPHHVGLLDRQDRARGHSRSRCPLRFPQDSNSPKKCPSSSTATTASFPACDKTDRRTTPFSRYMTLVAGWP